MPQVQVVDTTENQPEPTGVEQFFSRLGKSYRDDADRVEIGKLIQEYKTNQDNANAWEDLQLGLETSTISPSKRLETQAELNSIRKHVIERDKALNAQAKVMQKAKEAEDKRKADAEKVVKDQQETEAILLGAGYDPELATQKSKVLTPQSAKAEVDRKKEGDEYSKLREKSISEYVNDGLQEGEDAEGQKFAISEARKAVNGEVTGPGWQALLKHNPYSQLLIGLTPDEAALQAANKKLLEGSKGIFGAKPTEREIFLLLNEMLPSIGKTKEANEAGIDFIEKVNEMKIARSRVIDDLTNGGAKYVPDLQKKVNEQMRPLQEALKNELQAAVKKYVNPESKKEQKPMKVKAPDGSFWNMTQEQIDAAKEKGVNFEPVKK